MAPYEALKGALLDFSRAHHDYESIYVFDFIFFCAFACMVQISSNVVLFVVPDVHVTSENKGLS